MSITSLASSTSSLSLWEVMNQAKKAQKKDDLAAKLFGDLDADGNGGVSLQESGLEQETFNALDTDKDGAVSQDELAQAIELQRAAMHTRIKMEGQEGQGLPPPDDASASSLSGAAKAQEILASIMSGTMGAQQAHEEDEEDFASNFFTDLDTDGSGGISQAESGVDEATYDSMDTDHDGTVSASELTAALEKQRLAMSNAIDANASAAGLFSSGASDSASRAQRFLSILANNAYQSSSVFGTTASADLQALNMTA